MRSPDETYWNEYSNLQHTKHKIIRKYLQGWFPKLGFWTGRILYVDTHAGRGKHSRGQEGSPLVALRTFNEHAYRDRILRKCEVHLVLIEQNRANATSLENELRTLSDIHPKIFWRVYNRDSSDYLQVLADEFGRTGKNLAPSFMFVDPYGFKLPYDLLKKLKAQPRSELLINVMWRELDMAMRNPAFESTLDKLFGCTDWRLIRDIRDEDARVETTVQLLKRQLGAKWATHVIMLGANQRVRYFLVHLTSNESGRDLIKEVIWQCCPEGIFYVRKTDNPRQRFLIEPEPDLTLLRQWLLGKLCPKCYTWSNLVDLLRDEMWLNKHLWQVIRELKETRQITAKNFTGRFSQKANPTFNLA